MTADEARKLMDEHTVRLPECDFIDKMIAATCREGKRSVEFRLDRGSVGASWDAARLSVYYVKQGFRCSYSSYTFTVGW